MEQARTVLLSSRAASHHVWQASQFELEDVVAAVDDVHLLAPPGRAVSPAGLALHGAANRARRAVGRPRRRPIAATTEAIDAELFFAVFAAPHEIGMLPLVGPQLARSAVKVAFIVELWRPQVPSVADYLRQLRGFDHVFLFNRWAMDDVAALTGAQVSYLATAVDADRFAPRSPAPARVIDVMSYGRRLGPTHEALRRASAAGELFYHYDTVRGAFDVADHVEHREVLASTLQRSRYSIVYRNNDEPERVERTGGEESLTNRYFEVLAAGATMLGSAAQTPDFEACFDWPDAIVPIAAPDPRVADVVAELDADPARLERARRTAIAQSLRRHDWAHRWRQVLDTAGIAPRPQLAERLAHLERRAAAVEGAPTATGAGPGGAARP
ncbi:hypothetical protein AFE02nite_14570 [Actinotalea fermentans]|uniref:Spore protein YkvP/CgeB glycosyl transferase-like domain-containing protein n=2 Tax=Actinotalea fermentans TaxID=43671 RepID=A0A511YWY4_9CELL|nr:hypothetical protein AFE02nite_14570 [Actinotalea fermentans]